MLAAIDSFILQLLNDGALAQYRPRDVYRPMLLIAILGSTVIAVVDTVPDVWGDWVQLVNILEMVALALMTVDYLFRLRDAWLSGSPDDPQFSPRVKLKRYALSPYGIFDFISTVPFIIEVVFVPLSQDVHTVFGIMRFLKLARYYPALEILATVIIEEMKSLLSALFIVGMLVLGASTLMYFAERHAGTNFTTLPDAMWWAIVTLTTVGYGDVVPTTPLGKLLGGFVALMGLCMFALPASILATGFSEETRRRSFMNTWNLVSKVPMFSTMHAGQIAEIAAMLRPTRIAKGEVVVRKGDPGESMYFIVTGQLEVQTPVGVFKLKTGDFFGEIALVERTPRTATVVTASRTQLLELQVRDFQRFVSQYPELLEEIRKIAQSRMQKK